MIMAISALVMLPIRISIAARSETKKSFRDCSTPESSCDCHRGDLRSWTMHDHDQAADWYRKAAEQGGKTELKRLRDSL